MIIAHCIFFTQHETAGLLNEGAAPLLRLDTEFLYRIRATCIRK